eukprot:Amastigsp_a1040_13.p3 type:complete len:105 gc:universal Amastigsp_a1040_13:1019-705(-)
MTMSKYDVQCVPSAAACDSSRRCDMPTLTKSCDEFVISIVRFLALRRSSRMRKIDVSVSRYFPISRITHRCMPPSRPRPEWIASSAERTSSNTYCASNGTSSES